MVVFLAGLCFAVVVLVGVFLAVTFFAVAFFAGRFEAAGVCSGMGSPLVDVAWWAYPPIKTPKPLQVDPAEASRQRSLSLAPPGQERWPESRTAHS